MLKKRYFRFSLGAALAAITLLSTWLGYHAMQAAKLRELKANIQGVHGFIEFKDDFDRRISQRSAPKGALKNSPSVIPKEWFNSAAYIELTGVPIKDNDLRVLEGYRGLRVLSLGATQITDEGLKIVGTLADLDALGLAATSITDTGLKDLMGLEKLKFLDLRLTGVSDSGLLHLAKMKSLRQLLLSEKNFTEGAIDKLKEALPGCLIQFG